jgi:hypothetical protein
MITADTTVTTQELPFTVAHPAVIPIIEILKLFICGPCTVWNIVAVLDCASSRELFNDFAHRQELINQKLQDD